MILFDKDTERICMEKEVYNELLSFEYKKILELGCGKAKMTRNIAADCHTCYITATDIDQVQLEAQKAAVLPKNVRLAYGCAEDISEPTDTYHIVMLFKSMHHIPPDQMWRAIEEMHRVLKSKGQVYISEPVGFGPMSSLFRLFHDEREIQQAAFECVKLAVHRGLFHLENQTFFYEPQYYADFDEFREREIAVSYTDHQVTPDVLKQVHLKFEEFKHKNKYCILSARRVDLLRKIAE
jgi:ubiquinone/menaquinone biosynthesis C-methylase UbiE